MTDDQILEALLLAEGPGDPAKGYLAKDDRGGRTNWGISERAHPQEWADGKVPSRERAAEIYRTQYLKPFEGVDQSLKHQLVDIGVLSDPSRARALLALASRHVSPPRTLAVQLTVERLNFYADIVRRDPSQAKFLRGWLARACRFL